MFSFKYPLSFCAFAFTVIFFFGSSPLQSEVKRIEITWNALKCQNSCIEQIETAFKAIKEVKNFKMIPVEGTASMNWDTNAPFSYDPFRYASAAVGITIDTMRLVVAGTLSHEGEAFYLTSHPDGTKLQLLGPIRTEGDRYIIVNNTGNYAFSPQQREELLNFELHDSQVVVSGPMYLPYYKPNILIMEKIQLEKRKE